MKTVYVPCGTIDKAMIDISGHHVPLNLKSIAEGAIGVVPVFTNKRKAMKWGKKNIKGFDGSIMWKGSVE